jgi:hypothetical protein
VALESTGKIEVAVITALKERAIFSRLRETEID